MTVRRILQKQRTPDGEAELSQEEKFNVRASIKMLMFEVSTLRTLFQQEDRQGVAQRPKTILGGPYVRRVRAQ
jgi:hypothetical protein